MNDPFMDFIKTNLRYNYDHNQKDYLLFLRIPKNASSSIMEHLGDRNLLKKYESKLQALLDHKIYKGFFAATHARPHELESVINSIELKAFSFAVVRNPWDRVVSMYHFGKKMGLADLFGLNDDLSFEGFCEVLESRRWDRSFIPVFNQVEWTHNSIEVNEILKFENLAQDFSQMIKSNKLEGISPHLPHANQTNHKHYRDYFTSDTQRIIESIFEEDCDAFKYVF
tara:strand:+ start:2460 stop:3137 length:678 start_codon:yes stop_codon:yes gene_type:complete